MSELDEIPVSLVEEFLDSINITDEQIQIIKQQTLTQLESQMWFDQNAGSVTAASFYSVPSTSIDWLMNYCPLNSDSAPEQLVWGHE